MPTSVRLNAPMAIALSETLGCSSAPAATVATHGSSNAAMNVLADFA
jgi:hypothetical protein